ncbi:MAG: M50 family metallopeptidase [bacterium]|nr:M50 family metallopeptidase [bacterium]
MTIFLVIISLSILILVHELGHFLFAKLFKMPVEEFGIGFPPRLLKKKIGETVYSVNLLPFGGFVKITGENNEAMGQSSNARSFSSFPIWKRSVVILAGVASNIAIAWLALNVVFFIGVPKHLLATEILDNSPAEIAGLQSGDIILEVKANAPDISIYRNIDILHDPITTEDFTAFTKSHMGQTIRLTLQREKETIETEATLKAEVGENEGALGVKILEIGTDPEPFPKNVISGTIATGQSLSLITQSFYTLFTKVFTEPEIIEGISGPIGIVGIATQAIHMGFAYLLQFLALISLNLAVLNLIPFPALDGGRFLFLIIEKLIRRPISFKIQAITNTTGFALLVLLLILVTIKDISSLTG